MDPLTIAIFAGAGLKAFGQYQSGQAQSGAARQQAGLKRTQAREMLERMALQETRINEQGNQYKAKQLTDYAANGVAIGTGATLLAMEDTNMKITQQVDDMKRDTLYRVNQIKLGTKYDLQQGRQAADSSSIMASGSILEGATSYYKNVN